MVDSLVEMLVETSDLSIFWYAIILFKSEFEFLSMQMYLFFFFFNISVVLKTVQ